MLGSQILRPIKRGFHTGALLPALRSRGLISQTTSESFDYEKSQLGVYLGADPTADSLHLGNLIPFMVLMHFYIRGHRVFPLIGGATGVVGDPSGRKTERSEMAAKQREVNIASITSQMSEILKNCKTVARKYLSHELDADKLSDKLPSDSNVIPVNNASWWKDINMLWFLGTFGSHIRVSSMLARESVKQRLAGETGIGYNEFSYQVLQAYDFYHLYRHHNCVCQIGGHDQWGNITAGIDLINRLRNKSDPEPIGITVPLLTTPSGDKFGKSAGNAVFLSAKRTSPYHMFQYLVKSPDEIVEKYLKLFTFIPLESIELIMSEHWKQPEKRVAQQRLAFEVTELIHGTEQAQSAHTVSSVMFGDLKEANEILEAFKCQNLVRKIPHSELLKDNYKNLISLLSGKSKSESQRLIKNGSVYIGTQRKPLESLSIKEDHFDDANLLLIRIGKTEYYAVEATTS